MVLVLEIFPINVSRWFFFFPTKEMYFLRSLDTLIKTLKVIRVNNIPYWVRTDYSLSYFKIFVLVDKGSALPNKVLTFKL